MAQRAGVSFEVHRLALEGDELVVSGFWSGVRGLRFVRPALVSDEQRILATLEHKPWAPSMDAPWTAAFPWNGGDVDARRLALDVAPQVIVPLGDGEIGVAPTKATPVVEPEPLAEPEPEPEPPPVPVQVQVAAADPATDHRLDDLDRARSAAERDRDRALAQLAEAIEAREAAVRTRARMEIAHDEALQAREDAEAALARAKAEHGEANAQRDEVLLAYRTLRGQVQSERAQADRAGSGGEDDPSADADEPLGVRTVPAARTVIAGLQHPRRESKLVLSQFDLWIIRVLGVVAAGCFILLLLSILRVFF